MATNCKGDLNLIQYTESFPFLVINGIHPRRVKTLIEDVYSYIKTVNELDKQLYPIQEIYFTTFIEPGIIINLKEEIKDNYLNISLGDNSHDERERQESEFENEVGNDLEKRLTPVLKEKMIEKFKEISDNIIDKTIEKLYNTTEMIQAIQIVEKNNEIIIKSYKSLRKMLALGEIVRKSIKTVVTQSKLSPWFDKIILQVSQAMFEGLSSPDIIVKYFWPHPNDSST